MISLISHPGYLLIPVGSSMLGNAWFALLQCGGQEREPWCDHCVLATGCDSRGVQPPCHTTQRDSGNCAGQLSSCFSPLKFEAVTPTKLTNCAISINSSLVD